MLPATAILVHEHEVIGQALAVLDAMATRLAARGSVPVQDAEKLLEFFVVFADRCHHAKEEGILFPALEAAREYVALLEQHIAKENRALFPAADTRLTEKDDRAITAAFERHEQLEMGSGVHERFHRMLDDLAARYR